MLQFSEQCFYLLSRPLRAGERRRVRQFSRLLPGRFMHVNGEIFVSPTRAVCFLGARTATFGTADVGVRTIADIQPNVVELLTRRATIAIAFRLIGEALGTIERALLAPCAVPCAHVRSDATIQQPPQKLAVAVRGIGSYRRGLLPLPLRSERSCLARLPSPG